MPMIMQPVRVEMLVFSRSSLGRESSKINQVELAGLVGWDEVEVVGARANGGRGCWQDCIIYLLSNFTENREKLWVQIERLE